MKHLSRVVVPLVLAYCTILFFYVLLQRAMIFHPVARNGTTPVQFGLKNYQEVSFASGDGVSLTGWWVEHPKADPKRPVLLYCHGNADCLSDLAQVAKIFYDFGFDTLLFDYRSYGDSQKAPLSEAALDGDALAAYIWLKTKDIPEDRIFIWGHSLGSSVAAQLATKVQPAGLILEGAFPSVLSVSRQRKPWLLVADFMVKDKFETEKYVQARTCPLLETHAEKDTIIPESLGRQVFEEAAPPKQWLEIKGIDHNSFPSVAYQYKKPIMDFVKATLKAHQD
ncbi:MAG TPA: alpha/beta hydrolase [bacterium]|nr:alpha/beta hydrolase [bacterium]